MRAEIAVMVQGAVAAIPAGKEDGFSQIFKPEERAPENRVLNGQTALLGEWVERPLLSKGLVMNELVEMKEGGLAFFG